MRSRTSLSIAICIGVSFVAPTVTHASIPFLGPIIPQGQATCAGAWGLFILVVNNIIEFLITLVIAFIAPIMIAYSGFLFVVNPVNAGGKDKAKGILTNTVVGIVIALSAWLIVDAVMAVLYSPPSDTRGTWGKWTDLISGNSASFCMTQKGSLPGDVLNQVVPTQASLITGPGGEVAGIGKFTFQNSAIAAQDPDASGPLISLLSCMSDQMSTNAVITSISDEAIRNGKATIEQCAAQGTGAGCAHTANSCHYGGRECLGKSYAVDVSTGSPDLLTTIAQACRATVLKESTHLHISVGFVNNCGCDAKLE